MTQSILIIDDEEPIRDAFELALEDEPYIVVTCSNGREGLLEFEKNQPALVLLDLKMPEMDGVEVLRNIREANTEVPVYIVTAFQTEFMDDLKAAANEGLTFELAAKPLTDEEIRTIVGEALS
ncbi:MAG: response regulator [Gimesia sp.]|nr:response regulator [Gimesia sp.]